MSNEADEIMNQMSMEQAVSLRESADRRVRALNAAIHSKAFEDKLNDMNEALQRGMKSGSFSAAREADLEARLAARHLA